MVLANPFSVVDLHRTHNQKSHGRKGPGGGKWKPSGSLAEAKEFSKGGAYEDQPIYHHTTTDENVAAIRENGLNISNGVLGAYAHLSEGRDAAGIGKHATHTVTFFTNVKSPLDVESYEGYSSWWFANAEKGDSSMDPGPVLARHGYDSVRIDWSKTTFADERPYKWLLIPSKESVMAAEDSAELAFNPSQPRDSKGRWSSLGGLSFSSLKKVKTLGGSTGARLMENAKGKRFVSKRGSSEGHLREEQAADDAYRAAGVPVPEGRLIERSEGVSAPTKVTEFVEGKLLSDLRGGARRDADAEIRKGFAVDALLGNWDVLGLDLDNILVDGEGVPYRIDNGGSLRYRAMGAKKKPELFGPEVTEITSMRDPNRSAGRVFSALSDEELAGQIKGLSKKREKILNALPADLQGIVGQRLDYLSRWAEKVDATPKDFVANPFTPEGCFFLDEPMIDLAAWKPELHPRWPKGTPKMGGKFMPKGGLPGKFYTKAGQVAYTGMPDSSTMAKKHNVALGLKQGQPTMVNSKHVSANKLKDAASNAGAVLNPSEPLVTGTFDPEKGTLALKGEAKPWQLGALYSVYGDDAHEITLNGQDVTSEAMGAWSAGDEPEKPKAAKKKTFEVKPGTPKTFYTKPKGGQIGYPGPPSEDTKTKKHNVAVGDDPAGDVAMVNSKHISPGKLGEAAEKGGLLTTPTATGKWDPETKTLSLKGSPSTEQIDALQDAYGDDATIQKGPAAPTKSAPSNPATPAAGVNPIPGGVTIAVPGVNNKIYVTDTPPDMEGWGDPRFSVLPHHKPVFWDNAAGGVIAPGIAQFTANPNADLDKAYSGLYDPEVKTVHLTGMPDDDASDDAALLDMIQKAYPKADTLAYFEKGGGHVVHELEPVATAGPANPFSEAKKEEAPPKETGVYKGTSLFDKPPKEGQKYTGFVLDKASEPGLGMFFNNDGKSSTLPYELKQAADGLSLPGTAAPLNPGAYGAYNSASKQITLKADSPYPTPAEVDKLKAAFPEAKTIKQGSGGASVPLDAKNIAAPKQPKAPAPAAKGKTLFEVKDAPIFDKPPPNSSLINPPESYKSPSVGVAIWHSGTTVKPHYWDAGGAKGVYASNVKMHAKDQTPLISGNKGTWQSGSYYPSTNTVAISAHGQPTKSVVKQIAKDFPGANLTWNGKAYDTATGKKKFAPPTNYGGGGYTSPGHGLYTGGKEIPGAFSWDKAGGHWPNITQAEGWAAEYWKDWRGSLSKDEKTSLKGFKNGTYGDINGGTKGYKTSGLRFHRGDVSKLSEYAQGQVKQMDSAFEKAPELTDDILMHRGRMPDELLDLFMKDEEHLAVGETFVDHGYAPTSFKRSTANDFSGSSKYPNSVGTLRLPKGLKVLNQEIITSGEYNEAELLLPRGARFKVTKVWREESYGQHFLRVEADVLPPLEHNVKH